MNGLRPWIAAAVLPLSFVSNANAQAVAFVPSVTAFPNGVTMSATPVVSHDRRYVRLGMFPQFTVLEGFDPFAVPAAVTGGGGNGLGGGVGGAAGFAGMNGLLAVPPASSPPINPDVDVAGFGNPAAHARPGSGDFEDQPHPRAASPKKASAAPASRAKSALRRRSVKSDRLDGIPRTATKKKPAH